MKVLTNTSKLLLPISLKRNDVIDENYDRLFTLHHIFTKCMTVEQVNNTKEDLTGGHGKGMLGIGTRRFQQIISQKFDASLLDNNQLFKKGHPTMNAIELAAYLLISTDDLLTANFCRYKK